MLRKTRMFYAELLRTEIAMLRNTANTATGTVRADILSTIERLTDIANTLEGRKDVA